MYKGATTSSFSTCSFFRPASGRRLASRASSSLSKTLSLAHSSPISSPLSSTLFKFSRRQIGSSAAAWRYGGSWRLPVSCRARISRSSAAATERFERKMSTMAGENYFKDILRTLPKPVAEILGDITVYLRSMIRELKYKADGHDTIILAGAEYGSGSSRDWVAKGPMLLGVKAVIAKSFERIHRSNLVGMGIIPLCFNAGEDAESLGLTGFERCTIDLPSNIHDIRPGQDVTVSTDNGKSFTCIVRFDTEVELAYFHHGGILQYVIRSLISPQQ